MLFRINEGDGKPLYLIGFDDNDISKGITIIDLLISINNIIKITNIINCKISNINIYIYKGSNGYIIY